MTGRTPTSTEQAITPAQQVLNAAQRRIFWRLIPFLLLCYVFAFLDRSNIGFAKLQLIGDLGISEMQYGIAGGLFYLGYSLFEVPSNLLMARIGARKTLSRIMILWGVCSAITAFATSATQLYVFRLLLGAAEAGFFPGMILYLSLWVPKQQRARFTAVFLLAIAIAGLAGGPIAGWIMSSMAGVLGLAGWQWLFLLEGIPSCVLGLICLSYLTDRPEQAQWLTTEQRNAVLNELEQEEDDKLATGYQSLREALHSPRYYLLAGMSIALVACTGGMFLWFPTILSKSGVGSVANVGLLSAIPFAFGAVAQWMIARHSDSTQERRWHTALPAATAAVGWLLMPLVSHVPALCIVVMTLIAMGTLGAMGPYWSIPALVLSSKAAAGGIALISTFAGIASFISPIVVGRILDITGSLSNGQYYYAILMSFGVCALLLATRQKTGPSAPV